MPVWISSISSTTSHGVFAIEQAPPAQIQAIGTGVAALVGQFPWGPDGAVYEPPSIGEAKATMAPPGMDRLSTGYLSLIAKAWPGLRIVRVLGSTAAKATATLASSTPTNILTVTAKYKGTPGNSMVATVSAASDGDANHFDLAVTITGSSGTTTDTIKNINVSGVGADAYPSTDAEKDQLALVGGFTVLAAGRPANGNYTFSGGSTGTINAAAYVGTANSSDKGIALLESDKSVRHVFVDDCGNSLRAAVNAGIAAHCALMGDRCGYVNGDSGVSSMATVRTDAANYSSARIVYADPWVYVFDDVTGSKQLVPGSSFMASVAAQLSPSTSIAWKSEEVQAMLQGIAGLEYVRGMGAAGNTAAGVATFIREEGGGYTIEAGVLTVAPANPAKKNHTRTRIGDYIAVSLAKSLRSNVDAPNVRATWDLIIPPTIAFMEGLKRAQFTDPAHLPHVVDYQLSDVAAANTRASIQSGKLLLPMKVTTSASIEQLVFLLQFGETVTITLQQ
jgi:hypothetical protein